MAHPSLLEMPTELDTAATVVGLIILGLLISSIFLWISHSEKRGEQSALPISVPAWSIGWVNFGLFLYALIISVLIAQFLASKLVHHLEDPVAVEQSAEEDADPANFKETEETGTSSISPWVAVLAVLSLQIPMLATFYGLRKLYPKSFGGPLNRQSISVWKSIAQTIPYFIRYMPIIWAGSLVWLGVLTGLQKLGIVGEFPPQELVTMLSKGGHPVAIALIVASAITLVPIVEEIIFRGAIYRFFKGHMPILAAQFISGALFAAVHYNLMSFLPLMIIGVVLARAYEKHGTILVPIIFHAYWNGFSLLMLFLTSKSEVPFGS